MFRFRRGFVRRGRRCQRRDDDYWSMFEKSMGWKRQVVEVPDSNTEVLQVVSVDQNIKENTTAHHTDEFDITDESCNTENPGKKFLVVRRGQTFDLTINFNRPYDTDIDDLRLDFKIGKNPIPTNGTHVKFILSDKDEPKKWGAFIASSKKNTIVVTVVTPPGCYVGKWRFSIDVVKKEETDVNVYRWSQKQPIYVLFNPWNEGDQVFMKDDKWRKEYVLNETGRIYIGSSRGITARPWCFGQFGGVILDCCMYLLEKFGPKDVKRGDPVLVCRALSAAVNSLDDDGVLTGNWSGDYEGGVSPSKWTGSVEILGQFYKTKEPVQYGQCWVFSGVLTSVCRALGIPCRSVTNFSSSHDTDSNVTIDLHYDEDGEPIDWMNNDSVWNFHVWNDVWMARPDLPSGYGGWQAVDATPQETSDGVYQMGPASVNAIKRGDINTPHDAAFAFAEVNADKVHWQRQSDGSFKPVYKQKFAVGKKISTKAPGEPTRQDITSEYKFPEGSAEERAAVLNAYRAVDKEEDDKAYDDGPSDVSFDLIADDDAFVGDPIDVKLKIKNNSPTKRTVAGTVTIASVFYYGVPNKKLASKKLPGKVLGAGQEEVVSLYLDATDYYQSMVDHCMYRVSCMCYVEETKQVFTEVEDVRLRKPHLTVDAPSIGKVGEEITVKVSFVNPLQESLTGGELRVECAGMEKRPPIQLRKDIVQPKKTFMKSFKMTPVKPGNRELIVYYSCKQLESVNASHEINVKDI